MAEIKCSVASCSRDAAHCGLCNPHYKRLRRHGSPLSGGTERGAPKRFIETALATETDDCIDWPFALKEGYGNINLGNGAYTTASRFVCTMAHGEAPASGMEAAHSCGRPICCNKRHLRWATGAENSADKLAHGTQPYGFASASARFTDEQIAEMRRLRCEGRTLRAISEITGASVSYLSQLSRGLKRAAPPSTQEPICGKVAA